MMRFANVRALKIETKEVLAMARQEDMIITYRGKPWVLMRKMDEDDLEDYILTHHPAFRRLLERSLKEERAGKVRPLAKLAVELGIDL